MPGGWCWLLNVIKSQLTSRVSSKAVLLDNHDENEITALDILVLHDSVLAEQIRPGFNSSLQPPAGPLASAHPSLSSLPTFSSKKGINRRG